LFLFSRLFDRTFAVFFVSFLKFAWCFFSDFRIFDTHDTLRVSLCLKSFATTDEKYQHTLVLIILSETLSSSSLDEPLLIQNKISIILERKQPRSFVIILCYSLTYLFLFPSVILSATVDVSALFDAHGWISISVDGTRRWIC